MKKIYKTPGTLVVNIRCRALISTSLDKYDDGADNVVLTREYDNNSSISNKNVWDDEW